MKRKLPIPKIGLGRPGRPPNVTLVKILGMDALIDAITGLTPQPPQAIEAITHLAVIAVEGRNPMAPVIDHAPALNLSATQRVTLSAAPTMPDGTAAPGPHVWSTSDSAALPIEPASDGLTCDVLTPNDSGTGTITFTSPGVRTAYIKITYTAPVEGSANLSAGLPTED